MTPHRTQLKRLICLLALSLTFACQSEDAPLDLTPQDTLNEEWPGGSLQGWDDGEGSVETFTRREGGGSGLETGGSLDPDGYAEDVYAEAPPPEPGSEPSAMGGTGASSEGEPWEPSEQGSALEGGEIDDNDDLDAFIDYYEGERLMLEGDPSVEWRDLSERHMVYVTDINGVTVPDARITFTDAEGRVAQVGRTRADGSFAFFPLAVDVSPEAELEVEVYSRHGHVGPVTLDRAEDLQVLTLNGARQPDQEINLEVAFVIDATGSMGGEISRLKETITSIAERVVQPGVRLRLGAVAYRDRGDSYTTRSFNFTEDVSAFQSVINELQADGGGDYPEALNQALHEAQRRLTWTRNDSLRLTFLITDAPAHYYEDQEFTYADGIQDAQQMGMKIFPIASGGSDGVAELQLRQLAMQTLAHFIFITEGNGSPAGSEGSEYHVDPAQFDVERLDDLVVRLINEELDAWRFDGSSTPL
jgi:Mg-chelatase subunit ChlD